MIPFFVTLRKTTQTKGNILKSHLISSHRCIKFRQRAIINSKETAVQARTKNASSLLDNELILPLYGKFTPHYLERYQFS
jgi:hypothetical protein